MRIVRYGLALVGALQTPAYSQAPASWTPYQAGSAHRIDSRALGETRDIFVLPPRGFAVDSTPLPVMVLLDGDGLLPAAAGLSGFQQANAGSAPWLLVAVRSLSVNDRVRNFTPRPDSATRRRYAGAGGADAFRSFLEGELREYIAARYRTTDRWVLVGHSLAGLFATQVLAAPDTRFSDIVAISPTLGWQQEIAVTKVAERLRRPRREIRLFLSTADEGARYPVSPTRRLYAAIQAEPDAGVQATFRHFTGEDHVSTVPPALAAALRWLAAPTVSAPSAGIVPVPWASSPVLLDGRVGPDEWADARQLTLGSGVRMYVKRGTGYLYLALRPPTASAFGVDLYFRSEDSLQALNLHASARLGERAGEVGRWPEWRWWNNERWAANVARIESFEPRRFGADEAKEFQIALDRISTPRAELSVDIHGSASVSLPAEGASFASRLWVTLVFEP